MRIILGFAVLLLVAGCGGDDDASRAGGTSAEGDRVSFEVSSAPVEQTRVWAAEKSGGPPRGWWVGGGTEFFVETPAQTIEHPTKLTFTMHPDFFDDETRGRVDQLGVFLPGGLILGPSKPLMCPSTGRAEPDPCIASAEFLESGDARIVVLASDPSTG